MPVDFPDDESLMSEEPIHTPSESMADETCSDITSTMRDNCEDDRPETSWVPLFDLAFGLKYNNG